MIANYKEITWKYIKLNKKRSLLTLIGIVLSVALISTIGFFFKSMQEAQIDDMKSNYGAFHMVFKNVDDSLINKIKANPKVIKSGLYNEGEPVKINDNLNVIEINATDNALKLLPYKIREGRLPEKENEVAMEHWLVGKLDTNAKLGDKITILNKQYILVGLFKDSVNAQVEGNGRIFTKNPNVDKASSILLVELATNGDFKGTIETLKKLSNKNDVEVNISLVSMEGNAFLKDLIPVLAIIIGIVVIATIAVIYNSFQISVVERVKQFGLLRAVGATNKQIKNIIIREATLLAIIGIPIGVLCGIIALFGIHFVFRIIGGSNLVFIKPTISADVVLVSIIVGLISIYVSALVPALFAAKVSPLVAISSRNSITKEKLKRRRNFLVGKIFGFEGSLAAKNIKRNKKRYRTTVFSIVISVALFISFKSFLDMTLNVYNKDLNESNNVHFTIYSDGKSIDNSTINEIENIDGIKTVYKAYNHYSYNAAIDENDENNDIKAIGDVYRSINYNNERKSLLEGTIAVYDNKALDIAKKYIKEGSIDINELTKQNGVIIINKNTIYNKRTKKSYYGPVADFKVGDEIILQNKLKDEDKNNNYTFDENKVKKVKVLAILNSAPFDYVSSASDIKMITTEEVAKKLVSEEVGVTSLNITLKDIKDEKNVNKSLENILNKHSNLNLTNNIDSQNTRKASILMIQILLYGFVIVISLISSVNIINTLTTNIILRKRELASLKSIGLTQGGLKKMIILEGMLYGIVGSIYGVFIGTGLGYLLYKAISGVREQSYKLPITAALIAFIATIILGYLSVLSPLNRIKRENLIEAIREDY